MTHGATVSSRSKQSLSQRAPLLRRNTSVNHYTLAVLCDIPTPVSRASRAQVCRPHICTEESSTRTRDIRTEEERQGAKEVVSDIRSQEDLRAGSISSAVSVDCKNQEKDP